ncbi:hypothetical protein EYM_00685 [Ignicoccus islandicus DSM 13165]|uniref:DUF6884 domain-containing protein n=1 Tax=Ignicoccus islandicus DSM 13165 TaxID=940295 RepID=A0A0U3F3L2_9CREN|nr:DUF6884 domain-containing protein [Ignicoccus islandicus]ALU12133.1 hypothetical protein EYM_00685 [Ignicoccus islandicus DSM 13165]
MNGLVITNCTKRKRSFRGPAKEIYMGSVRNLFRLAEEMGLHCYVLSAKYGLIRCDETIEPYDSYVKDLNEMELIELKEKVRRRCNEVRGPWDLVITNLSSSYAPLLDCEIVTERALIIGTRPPKLSSSQEVAYSFKTLGERNKLLGNVRELLSNLLSS